ncbi:MAG: DUF5777 family beta-barrel protein [Saprospiraceae bacterium]
MFRILSICFAILLQIGIFTFPIFGQEDLLELLGEETPSFLTAATFKSTRIINSQSIENSAKGVLDIKIQHRFSSLDRGVSEFFGLDGATIRIGADYGLTNRLMTGIGRSSLDKAVDGFLKYKVLRQRSGKNAMPLSVSLFGAIEIKTTKFADETRPNYFSSRLYYSFQILLARKFSDGLSIQLMPTLLHRNLVGTNIEKNDVYSLGIGLRQKISKRTSINIEYFYNPKNQLAKEFVDPLSIGFDIETGGHVFQLHFTNATAMIYKGFLGETKDTWEKGQIHFGFNISRVFTLVKPKLLE